MAHDWAAHVSPVAGKAATTLSLLASTMAWHHHPAQGQHFCFISLFGYFALWFLACSPIFFIFFLSTSTWGSTRIGGGSHRTEVGLRVGWHIRQTYPASDFTFNFRALLDWLGEPPLGSPLIHCRRTSRFDWKCTTGHSASTADTWRSASARTKSTLWLPQKASPSIPAGALTFEPLRNQKVHWSHRSSCHILVAPSPASRAEKGKLLLIGTSLCWHTFRRHFSWQLVYRLMFLSIWSSKCLKGFESIIWALLRGNQSFYRKGLP